MKGRTLLLGEGNFSYALSLAQNFGGENLVATSLDSLSTVKAKYTESEANLDALRQLGATVLHGVDAQNISAPCIPIQPELFDLIVFNFPHVGVSMNHSSKNQWAHAHHKLICSFLREAVPLLKQGGEIHLATSHCGGLFCHGTDLFGVEKAGRLAGLVHKSHAPFDPPPGYSFVATSSSPGAREGERQMRARIAKHETTNTIFVKS